MVKGPLIFILSLLLSHSVLAQTEVSDVHLEIESLHERIDYFFEASKRLSNDEVIREHLEFSRIEIHMALIDYHHILKEVAPNLDKEALARAMHTYNLVLIKSYLPRYEPPKRSLYKKVIQHADPVAVEPILSRAEAANLFFMEIPETEVREGIRTEDRVTEVIDLHNSIIKKVNAYRETVLFSEYNAKDLFRAGASEADIYRLVVSGQLPPSETSGSRTADYPQPIEVSPDHFAIQPTCSGLFAH